MFLLHCASGGSIRLHVFYVRAEVHGLGDIIAMSDDDKEESFYDVVSSMVLLGYESRMKLNYVVIFVGPTQQDISVPLYNYEKAKVWTT